MPDADVYLYREADGSLPLLQWLDRLPNKARLKCLTRISRLTELGHALRRPEADLLRDGIYELRASYQGVHYRVLYFFRVRRPSSFPTGSRRNAAFQTRR